MDEGGWANFGVKTEERSAQLDARAWTRLRRPALLVRLCSRGAANARMAANGGAPTEAEPEKLTVDAGGDSANATFTFHEEDHTIGNTLRYILNKNPEVAFVGYSVPHPSEPKMNLRLQTVGPPATTVLHNALGTVYEIGGHVLSTFDKAVAEFKEKEQQKR